MIEVTDAPELYQSDVIEKLRSEIGMKEYLFYRTGYQELDIFLEGKTIPVWEMECTACGATFHEPKERKNPPKGWKRCPICGAEVEPRRWNERAVLNYQRMSYYLFQRDGERMWARGFQISRMRDASFDAFEFCRIVYYPGGARKWTRSRDYFYGVHDWKPVRNVSLKRWHRCFGKTEDNWFGTIELDEVRGTCIEYSQLDRAISELQDPLEYLVLYMKYPRQCEMLWKMGLGWMLRKREQDRAGFQKCVNLRAKKPAAMLRGLKKADIEMLQTHSMTFNALDAYQKLRAVGAIKADDDGARYADGVGNARERVRERCLELPDLMYKYLSRQEKRMDLGYCYLLIDWGDYLDELDEVGGGDEMPDDLREAHARLSARLRKKQMARNNPMFRVRRRLMRDLVWRHGGLLIRPIDSEEEIVREGEMQNNCVARYAKRHAEGQTAILVLRKAEQPTVPFCTVEYNRKTNVVLQCRSYRNGAAPEDARAFIAAWLARNAEMKQDRRKET